MVTARQRCGVEQWSARQPHKLEVAGSSPAPATNYRLSLCSSVMGMSTSSSAYEQVEGGCDNG